MSKFITKRVHERIDPKLVDRVRLARQRLEGGAPLYWPRSERLNEEEDKR